MVLAIISLAVILDKLLGGGPHNHSGGYNLSFSGVRGKTRVGGLDERLGHYPDWSFPIAADWPQSSLAVVVGERAQAAAQSVSRRQPPQNSLPISGR